MLDALDMPLINMSIHAPDRPCKVQGAMAADADVAIFDNPYLPGTADFASWMEGWCNRTAIRWLAEARGNEFEAIRDQPEAARRF
jgi:hypothetical protein